MAFLKLADEFLTLHGSRLALYDNFSARLSETGGGSGAISPQPTGALGSEPRTGAITDDAGSGKVTR
jgi:hypothetical protein